MAETIYHVDKNDNVIGPIDRDTAHREGLLHRSGMVFLIRSDREIMLQHRSMQKKTFPDCKDASCTFHVSYGESYEQAAQRELLEETGATSRIKYLGKFLHEDGNEHQIVAVFLTTNDSPIKIDENEATGFEFVEKKQVDQIIAKEKVTPWLREGWKVVRERL